MIKVGDSNYRLSHGKAPKGRGLWAFDVIDTKSDERVITLFVPSAMTYDDARSWARHQANQLYPNTLSLGRVEIQVAP